MFDAATLPVRSHELTALQAKLVEVGVMPWIRMPSSTPAEIKLLQRTLAKPDPVGLSGVVEALDATLQNRLWAEQQVGGKPIEHR
jgi:hypothetical protein